MIDDGRLLGETETELKCFQALLFRGYENRTNGAKPVVYLDMTRSGLPAWRSIRALDAAWYRLVWQHNLVLGQRRDIDLNDLVGEHNWQEFQLLLTPMDWFETEAYLERGEVCPDTWSHAPSAIALEDLWRWNGMVNRT